MQTIDKVAISGTNASGFARVALIPSAHLGKVWTVFR
jgi:hypothetical protein